MRIASLLPVLLLLVAMQTSVAQESDISLSNTARMIAQRALIVDTHIDVPYRVQEAWVDVTRATEGGDFDYERAQRGGLNIPFMSIYTPAKLEVQGGSFKLANQLKSDYRALQQPPENSVKFIEADLIPRVRNWD